MHVYIPTDDETVVKKVCLDVLHPDGFIEAFGHQKTQQPPQVWCVVQGHSHLIGETLEQRQ